MHETFSGYCRAIERERCINTVSGTLRNLGGHVGHRSPNTLGKPNYWHYGHDEGKIPFKMSKNFSNHLPTVCINILIFIYLTYFSIGLGPPCITLMDH